MEDSISTGSDSGAVTTGPATFSDPSLSWSEDSSSSTPSADSTLAASASADATDPPVIDAPTEDPTPGAGEPPKERWNDILANARAKAAEDAIAPYSWAKSVSQEEFNQVRQMAQRAGADPIGYLQDFIKELQSSPEHAAQLRSLAAKALAQRTQPTEPQEPQPDLPIQLEDGRVVHLYSAEQQAKREAFLQQQWMQAVEQKIQPFRQTHEQLQAERQQAQAAQANTEFATSITADVKSRPGVDDAAMKAMAAEIAQDRLLPATPSYDQLALATERAYRKVVLPTLSQQAQAKLLDNLQQKATASTSVNPGSASPSAPRSPRSFHDASLQW
jgi:hypothetical protein